MLNKQIQEVIHSLRGSLPANLSALIEEGAGEISALDIAGQALDVGDQIPDFSLNNYNGEDISIADYLRLGPVVLTFYRGVWCPYCNLQLAEYNRHLAEIRLMGADLIAISPQSADAEDVFRKSDAPEEAKSSITGDLDFTVLQDPGNRVAAKFGLVFDLPKAHLKLFDLMNLDLEAVNGDSTFAVPDPATFIISQNSKIHWRFVPNNYRKRAEIADIISALVDA